MTSMVEREVAADSEAGAAPATGRERDVIAAFAEITTEAITDTRLEDLLSLVGQKLCALLGVTRCSVYLRHANGSSAAAPRASARTPVTSPRR